jgi:hypothetical protein
MYFGLGTEQAQARARAGLGLGQSPWAWIFGLFSKSPSLSPILLNKHPGPECKAQARILKAQSGPTLSRVFLITKVPLVF